MTYAVGGLIQASDYNRFASDPAHIGAHIGVGHREHGLGQPALTPVAVDDLVTAAQWNKMITSVNKVLLHTGRQPIQTGTKAPGDIIAYLSTAMAKSAEAYASAGTTGLTNGLVSATNTQYNTVWPTSVAAWSQMRTDTLVTFASADAARFFFNAGGTLELTYEHIPTTTGPRAAKSATLAKFAKEIGTVSIGWKSTSKSGGTFTGNASHAFFQANAGNGGYWAGNGIESVTQFRQGSSDDSQMGVRINTWYAGGVDPVHGGTFSIGIQSFLSTPTQPVSGVTTLTVKVKHPSTTHLANTWGTPTVTTTFTPLFNGDTQFDKVKVLLQFDQYAVGARLYEARFTDVVGNNFASSNVGSTPFTIEAGKYGSLNSPNVSALHFPYSSSVLVQYGTSNLNFGTGDVTIEGWFKWNTAAANRTYIVDGRTANTCAIVVTPTGRIGWMVNGAWIIPEDYPAAANRVASYQWTHIAAVIKDHVPTIYVNGQVARTAGPTGAAINPGLILINANGSPVSVWHSNVLWWHTISRTKQEGWVRGGDVLLGAISQTPLSSYGGNSSGFYGLNQVYTVNSGGYPIRPSDKDHVGYGYFGWTHEVGTPTGSTSDQGQWVTGTSSGGSGSFLVDEFRITAAARYNGPFTPPASYFTSY